ncbi:unnamed protein product [Discula destructiva]
MVEGDGIEKPEVRRVTGKPKWGHTTANKRLTVVDELEVDNHQVVEDPFLESSSGHNTTKFEARLLSGQSIREVPTPTDPFQAEHVLESSVDAMLLTPPVGCSTPRRRNLSVSRSETPTKASRGKSDHGVDLISISPGRSSMRPTRATRHRSPSNNREIASKESQKLKDERDCGSGGWKSSLNEKSVASDSTRLSSYPPGSTIRHVPRSMGRLREARFLPGSAVERARGLALRIKKHPSPSKGQLELFGKVMEKNLALGVFKDVDELGMSFNSPQPATRTLSPRDTNRLMRNMTTNNIELCKDNSANGNRTGLLKSRSRIPQPVRQLSRSRTDTAFARDFIPANKGDSTAGDELQWDSSTYKVGHRCSNCGSTNEIAQNTRT